MFIEARETKFGFLHVGDIIVIKTKKGEAGIARIFSLDTTHHSELLKDLNFHWLEGNETWKAGESLEGFEAHVTECSIIRKATSEEEWQAIMHMYKQYGDIFRCFAEASSNNEKRRSRRKKR